MKIAVAVGVISVFLGSLASTALAADRRTCQIDRISGDQVALRKTSAQQASSESIKVVAGLNIPAGATLETGSNSRVVLLCDDSTSITIGPDTEIALPFLIGNAGPQRNVLLRLLQGIVGIVAPKQNWRHFKVETSLAIASVRSTDWLVESDSVSGTAVFVTAGSVDVLASQQSFLLEPGEGITLKPAAATGVEPEIPEVKRWGEARIAKSRIALGFDWE